MKIILLGPPGAGKGTQAKSLSRQLEAAHISTGDILRLAIKQGSPLGKEAKRYVESGELVPDSLVTRMVIERLSLSDAQRSFILDGFPRNVAQAKDLDNFLNTKGPLDYVAIYLEASDKMLIQRLSGRRICRNCQAVFHLINMPPEKDGVCDNCGGELYQRPDDTEATIINRLEVYKRQTAPLVEYYSIGKVLVRIDADRDAQIVLQDMLKVIGDKTAIKHPAAKTRARKLSAALGRKISAGRKISGGVNDSCKVGL